MKFTLFPLMFLKVCCKPHKTMSWATCQFYSAAFKSCYRPQGSKRVFLSFFLSFFLLIGSWQNQVYLRWLLWQPGERWLGAGHHGVREACLKQESTKDTIWVWTQVMTLKMESRAKSWFFKVKEPTTLGDLEQQGWGESFRIERLMGWCQHSQRQRTQKEKGAGWWEAVGLDWVNVR